MTHDDLQFMQDVAGMFGRPPLPASKVRRERMVNGSVSAAIVATPRLFVVTLDFTKREPLFVAKRSAIFELEDRSAASVRRLSLQVGRYVARASISELYLRGSTGTSGTYAPHLYHAKIETILQLVDPLEVIFVNTQSVRAWVNREEPDLPDAAASGLGKNLDDKRDLAIETALFVAANANVARYFSRGEKPDD